MTLRNKCRVKLLKRMYLLLVRNRRKKLGKQKKEILNKMYLKTRR